MNAEHETSPNRRLPREEVRRRLLAEAARVFAERGYADARIEDIAAGAGFTKGAVYSNFGGKQELFGAILGDSAETELAAVREEIRDTDDLPTLIGRVASLVARRIVEDDGRGHLGLEFAARAARDEPTREILTPMRRAQREGAARSIAEVAGRTGARPAVDLDQAALILHCLTNGLVNEHIADPEEIDAETVERALTTVLTCLLPLASGNDQSGSRSPT
ncbi:TetR/AcrR family transcriptional regulator [Nonomuraea sp. SBT364]|uniref:TetR/AcrR family transcriptional regulator n=1 Tax=Nonomuraea sp. SBT364 TaxID=1580530 RepID=UPI00066CF85A|nr:TetR/AcrR family transcriptional regulator [Nonomuraea sp. SBT364]